MQNLHLLVIFVFHFIQSSVNLPCTEDFIKTDGEINFLSMKCSNDFKMEIMCAKEKINKSNSKANITQIHINNCTLSNSPNSLEILKELNISYADVLTKFDNIFDEKTEKIISLDCGVHSLRIKSYDESISDQFFQIYRNVSELVLNMSLLKKMPNKLFANMKHLKHLTWYNMNRTVFERADIEELYELETITINLGGDMRNSCTQFPLSFDNMTQLKKVFLYNTFGNCIDENLFKGADNLEKVEISGNHYLQKLPDKLFDDQINLESLELQRNGLKAVQDVLFINLKKLRRLDLFGNEIKNINWVTPLLSHLEYVNILGISTGRVTVLLQHIRFKMVPNRTLNSYSNNVELHVPDNETTFNWLEELPLKTTHLDLRDNELINNKSNELQFLQENKAVNFFKIKFNSASTPWRCDGNFTSVMKLIKKSAQSILDLNQMQIKYINCILLNSPTNNSIEILRKLSIPHQVGIKFNGTTYSNFESSVSIDHGVKLLENSTNDQIMKEILLQNYQNLTEIKLTLSDLNNFWSLRHLNSLDWKTKNFFDGRDDGELLELETLTMSIDIEQPDNCTNFPLSFKNMKHLRKVVLRNTFGNCIDEYLFKGAYNLEEVEITGNHHLKDLPPRLFKDLKNLQILNLSGNALKNVRDALFFNLTNLHLFVV